MKNWENISKLLYRLHFIGGLRCYQLVIQVQPFFFPIQVIAYQEQSSHLLVQLLIVESLNFLLFNVHNAFSFPLLL